MGPKTYHIRTFGCQMNDRDSERMAALLESMGYIPADGETPDIVVVNTCSVREKPQMKVYSELGRHGTLKRKNPKALIAVAGCVAQQEGEALLKRVPHLDIVMGTRAIARLPELVQEALRGKRMVATEMNGAAGLFGAQRPAASSPAAAMVVAMTGCSNHCAYCIVPAVRGPAVSRPADEILEEVAQLADRGVREITLLGQNVNAYNAKIRDHNQIYKIRRNFSNRNCDAGFPNFLDFPDLLKLVSQIDGIERIRFVTSHPKDLSDKLIEEMATNPKVCEYLHLPIQAGSDRVLENMGRGYTRARYIEMVKRLKESVKGLALSGDFIVGFPGETREDFMMTMDVIERVRYHQIYSFRYSDRPNTPAAKMENPVDKQTGMERLHILQARQEEITREIMEAMVGKEEDILIEGPSKTDPEKSSGRTRSNLTVHINGRRAPGWMTRVRIVKAFRHSLEGEEINGR